MKLVYDIETDGLDATKIWVLIAKDIDTGTIYKFSDHDNLHGSIQDGVNLLANASLLIGHNIIGFDNRVIDKLYGVDLNNIRCHDTFIMSQVLRYKRNHRHGLAGWGEALGNKKIEYDDWSNYNKAMLKYCIQDVNVNHDVYNELLKEYKSIYERNPKIKEGLQVEHSTAIFNARVREAGWKFDTEKATSTLNKMLSRMEEIEAVIEPKLGMKTVYIDKEPKTPKYKKNGDYNHHTVRQLSEFLGKEIKPSDTDAWPAGKPFQRVTEEQIELGSTELVKEWLLANGWKPDEYQKKKIGFEWIVMGPKLTSTSLKAFGKDGELIDEYYTIRSRKAVIEGWLAKSVNGRLHGNMWTCGTPTFRCRHEVIVNLPAINAEWGKELRELLIADDDMVVVGADSSGNQLRGLCHYVGNDSFTNEVIYGDQHQRNADALGCSRPIAKSYLYAYLFGAGDAKLGLVLTGKASATVGRKSREDFAKSIKGLAELKTKLTKIFNATKSSGNAWIPGLDGRPVFVPGDHQALNYLLQSAEGITCKAAVHYQMEKIKEEGLRAEPRLFYHDETAWISHPDDAERVGQILKESFEEGPKMFNVTCMDGGDPCYGGSYADVH